MKLRGGIEESDEQIEMRATLAFATICSAAATVAIVGSPDVRATDANGSTYTLTGFDYGSKVLSGVDAQERSFSAPYAADTDSAPPTSIATRRTIRAGSPPRTTTKRSPPPIPCS